MRGELGRSRIVTARQLVGEARVQPLPLAGQDRAVDRLGEQRMTEAVPPAALVGHEDAMLDRRAQRLAHAALGERRDGDEQRIGDVASSGGGYAQQALCAPVQSGHPRQERVAQAARELGVVSLADRAEQLLGKERVALRAGQDRVCHRRRQGAGARVEQRRELRALERPELEDLPRAGAPDAVGQPMQPGRRRRLVGAQRREQEDAPGVEVVREVDDDVKRRGVGPVQVLENEQHGDGGGALAQQRERRLEYASLRASRADPSERPQRLGERLEGKLGADEVQRAPEQHLEAGLARAGRELGRQPRLADPRFAGEEHGRAPSSLRCAQRSLKHLELSDAPDKRRARAHLHAASIAVGHA